MKIPLKSGVSNLWEKQRKGIRNKNTSVGLNKFCLAMRELRIFLLCNIKLCNRRKNKNNQEIGIIKPYFIKIKIALS